jgi:hypothetical protein
LDNLSCISEAKYEQTLTSNKTLAHLYKLQIEWINFLFTSAKIGHNDSLDGDTLIVSSSDDHIRYPVQRQGPFLISHTKPLDNGIQTSDILYINVEPVNILAMSLNNGTVHNYIIGSEIDAQWQMPVKNAKHDWQKEVIHVEHDSVIRY